MKQVALLRLAQRVLGDSLVPLGFQFYRGAYFRELPTEVIHIIGITLDVRSTETFRVMCGVTSRLLYPDKDIVNMGVFGRDLHITAQGWDCNSGRWPCHDEAAALESLRRIKELVNTHIEPRFQATTTLSALAENMNTEQHGMWKAMLLRTAGNMERARQVLLRFRDRLSKPKPWDDPDAVEAEKAKADALLREMESQPKSPGSGVGPG